MRDGTSGNAPAPWRRRGVGRRLPPGPATAGALLDPTTGSDMHDRHERLRALGAARWRIAGTLTVAMMVLYFGFIGLIAFDKLFLARLVAPGLTLGILLGALVIVASWALTWVYVRWANAHYDAAVDALKE